MSMSYSYLSWIKWKWVHGFAKLLGLGIGYLWEYNMRLNETDLKVRKRDKDETLLNERHATRGEKILTYNSTRNLFLN
jgi:hypothetical protein